MLQIQMEWLKHCLVYVIGVPAGKTAWTSTRSTWSGRRNLIKADNYSSLTINRGDVNDSWSVSVPCNERLLSMSPSWCYFVGMIMSRSRSWCDCCYMKYV